MKVRLGTMSPGRKTMWAVLVLVSPTLLAGCATIGATPVLDVSLIADEIPADGALSFMVTLDNDSERTFIVEPYDECLHLLVVVIGPDGRFQQRLRSDGMTCHEGAFELAPGAIHGPVRFEIPFNEHRNAEGPFFRAGVPYRVQVGYYGDTTWDVATERAFIVTEALDLPTLTIAAEHSPWPAGEDNRFTVTFHNRAERGFTYTAAADCEVRLWVEVPEAPERRVELLPRHDGCPPTGAAATIGPDATRTWTATWDGRVNADTFAPPGPYIFHAAFTTTDATWDAATDDTFVLGRPDTTDTSGNTGAVEDSNASPDLPVITIAPDAQPWQRGQQNTVRVWFHNTADQAYTFTSPDSCADIHLTVTGDGLHDPHRLWPAEGSYVCGQAITDAEFAPGQNVTWTLVWDGTDGDGNQVEPGSYRLDAVFKGSHHAWDTASSLKVTLA